MKLISFFLTIPTVPSLKDPLASQFPTSSSTLHPPNGLPLFSPWLQFSTLLYLGYPLPRKTIALVWVLVPTPHLTQSYHGRPQLCRMLQSTWPCAGIRPGTITCPAFYKVSQAGCLLPRLGPSLGCVSLSALLCIGLRTTIWLTGHGGHLGASVALSWEAESDASTSHILHLTQVLYLPCLTPVSPFKKTGFTTPVRKLAGWGWRQAISPPPKKNTSRFSPVANLLLPMR